MIMKLFPVILFFMVHYNCIVTTSNTSHTSHNHIVNSKTSKLKLRKSFNAIGKKLITDVEKNPMNKGCKCSRKGECKPKGCKVRRTGSRSIAG